MESKLSFPETIPSGEVRRALGCAPSKLPPLMAKHGFPKPVKFGHTRRWIKSEVQAWLDARLSDRSDPAA